MSKAFEKGLATYLDNGHRLTTQERRVKRILDLPKNNPRRKRVLANLETGFSAQLAEEGVARIEWDDIDWASLLETLVRFIKMVIDLFGGL